MLKWLVFLVFVAWLASNWTRRAQRGDDGASGKVRGRARRDRGGPKKAERMLRCDHCDVHVPASMAIHREGHNYCCPAHAEAAGRSDGT